MTPEMLRIGIGLFMLVLSGLILLRFWVNWLMHQPEPKMPPIKHIRNWHDQPGVK